MKPIKMVDLHQQYLRIKQEVDEAIAQVLERTDFIQGEEVRRFESELSRYLDNAHVVSCANGTDALQLAMMALGFKPGDEVIVPVHTYVATAEVIALLQLVPVFADVDEDTFTIDATNIERLITRKTVAIVPVHLYGQCADLQPIMELASERQLHVIEDAAQSLGAVYSVPGGSSRKGGTIGTIGTTSFFPSKNLGAFGDGGAIFTHDDALAAKLRMIANHGQNKKYHHDSIGVNSRLDTLQAAILRVKLKYLDEYASRRNSVADFYDSKLKEIEFIKTPRRASYSSHVFHQYTIQVKGIDRDALKAYLQEKGIPSMIYYPIPLHLQQAYRRPGFGEGSFNATERLSRTVLSLPVHTEMDEEQLSYICDAIRNFN